MGIRGALAEDHHLTVFMWCEQEAMPATNTTLQQRGGSLAERRSDKTSSRSTCAPETRKTWELRIEFDRRLGPLWGRHPAATEPGERSIRGERKERKPGGVST